ncbi:AraC family transcriptional regulator [Alcanivorax hongdengensis A-11-3]|uniref:AraC family transcriptional regulator n=1 Tax=Alcanivorax hongdengensis A-11-3 TaxID=1177179 RepID=L0WGN4_9GAMM|nr:AraC family transcriptional regulator [Alcanivorax hongdengensis]EKF74970.1 AraC family transcriptional regulator [Alcanivorax hongdengensis A-11-3]
MTDLGEICSAALKQYLAHGDAIGLDTAAALDHAGLPEELVQQPEARLPGRAFQQLLENLIQQSADPLFGLHTSAFIQPGSYNVIGYIAMSAGTLLEALSKVSLYERLVGDMGTTETRLDNDQAMIIWSCCYPAPARRHLVENVLSSWLCYARWLTANEQLAPSQVWLEHSAPQDPALLAEYRRVFLCDVLFDQPCSALVGDSGLLAHPLTQPDPLLLSTLEAHAVERLNQLGVATSLSQRVRQCIDDAMGRTLPRKDQVAERLGMNIRTLHRRLADEQVTWQQLLDDVRLQHARQLLQTTQLPQSEIAEALGYSDIRSFQRSFKRHTGQTPGQFRSRPAAL